MEKVVILGGGVGGLTALNTLLDRGYDPLLIEAGAVGSPKICGEFIAHSAGTLLEKWGIGPLKSITSATFVAYDRTLSFPLTAYAYPRSLIELELMKRALSLGGRIKEHTPITSLSPQRATLQNGDFVESRWWIVATGKITPPPQESSYITLKAHFRPKEMPEGLTMHSFPGGYYGIIPIAPDLCNMAAIVKKGYELPQIPECTWQRGNAGIFGFKKIPRWPNAFWIADAFMTFPPAAGLGLQHAILSAVQACDAFVQKAPEQYHRAYRAYTRPKLLMAKSLHALLLRPRLATLAFPLINPFVQKIVHNLLV